MSLYIYHYIQNHCTISVEPNNDFTSYNIKFQMWSPDDNFKDG
jgi:hypothetical protein